MGIIEILENTKFLGNRLIDVQDLQELVFRFLINGVFAYWVAKGIYYNRYKVSKYLYTFLLFNVCIFLVCTLLSGIKLSIGFAFGLFAVFSILRYRTEPIPIKEMTYLFVIITLSIINALSNKKVSYLELMFTNLAIVGTVYLLETLVNKSGSSTKSVTYEKIKLIKPEHKSEMIEDLKERTGLNVYDAKVERINFLNDTARVTIYFTEA
ncbi:MAG: DUF4956 domain-containing protein [Flavobacteriales bacterium]|nr:DUF4956 domain-containing protein [Flavobacteriales bacterium]